MKWMLLVAIAVGFCAATAAQAQPHTQSVLQALSGQGTGRVEVSPTSYDPGEATFDVQGTVNIHDVLPNVTFTVLRRVDLIPDGICTGSVWLSLPGSPPPVLVSSPGGAGALHFEIARGAPFVDEVKFDVIWRLVGIDGTILESDCFTVTVK